MKPGKDLVKIVCFYIVGKLLYWLVWPFYALRNIRVSKLALKAVKSAKKRADEQHELTGKKMFVFKVNGEYKVLNRGGMLNVAKALKKAGHNMDWHNFVIYETK